MAEIGDKYRLARKKIEERIASKKEKEKENIKVLNEIAKLKGYKGRKRVEKTGDKIKIMDVSPLAEWAEYHAKELGFGGKKKGEKVDGIIIEKTITPIEEFTDYIVEKSKTSERPLSRSDVTDAVYAMLIPQAEISEGLDRLKKIWLESHEKFIQFCSEFAQNIKTYYVQNKTNTAAITMDNMFNVLEEYHRAHPKSMNIYSRDDLAIGLGYCLPERGIYPRMTATKRAIIFEEIS